MKSNNTTTENKENVNILEKNKVQKKKKSKFKSGLKAIGRFAAEIIWGGSGNQTAIHEHWKKNQNDAAVFQKKITEDWSMPNHSNGELNHAKYTARCSDADVQKEIEHQERNCNKRSRGGPGASAMIELFVVGGAAIFIEKTAETDLDQLKKSHLISTAVNNGKEKFQGKDYGNNYNTLHEDNNDLKNGKGYYGPNLALGSGGNFSLPEQNPSNNDEKKKPSKNTNFSVAYKNNSNSAKVKEDNFSQPNNSILDHVSPEQRADKTSVLNFSSSKNNSNSSAYRDTKKKKHNYNEHVGSRNEKLFSSSQSDDNKLIHNEIESNAAYLRTLENKTPYQNNKNYSINNPSISHNFSQPQGESNYKQNLAVGFGITKNYHNINSYQPLFSKLPSNSPIEPFSPDLSSECMQFDLNNRGRFNQLTNETNNINNRLLPPKKTWLSSFDNKEQNIIAETIQTACGTLLNNSYENCSVNCQETKNPVIDNYEIPKKINLSFKPNFYNISCLGSESYSDNDSDSDKLSLSSTWSIGW